MTNRARGATRGEGTRGVVAISAVRRLSYGTSTVFVWSVVMSDDVVHRVGWLQDQGGKLRVSWPVDNTTWSQFVDLGPEWSPRPTLREAHDSVVAWAHATDEQQCRQRHGRHRLDASAQA